jgi:probable HAF family extracellular repeat protein
MVQRMATVAVLGVAFSTSAVGEEALYTLRILEPLQGMEMSYAEGISDSGIVVGFSLSLGLQKATVWRDQTPEHPGDLPTGFLPNTGLAVNGAGVVVGSASNGRESHAFRWLTGIPEDLTPTLGQGRNSGANDINATGQIVGCVHQSVPPKRHATLWDSTGVVDLTSQVGTTGESDATAINAQGHIVGWTETETGYAEAFLWIAGDVTFLGDLEGGDPASSGADINSHGWIVGDSSLTQGRHAVVWTNGTLTDLGDLPGGDNSSSASAVNDCGLIVGNGCSSRIPL